MPADPIMGPRAVAMQVGVVEVKGSLCLPSKEGVTRPISHTPTLYTCAHLAPLSG